MGRLSSFEDGEVFATVGRLLAEDGQVTIGAVREATGLSTGSLYHRFESREALMAEAWLYAVGAFQARILEAFALKDAQQAGVEAALATPRFCREEKDIALVLACCRPAEFLTKDMAPKLQKRVKHVNDNAAEAIRAFAKRIDRPLLTCRLAIVAYPLGAVRLFLPRSPVPPELDDELRTLVAFLLR
jgi:AcrR family transcriptional regulator